MRSQAIVDLNLCHAWAIHDFQWETAQNSFSTSPKWLKEEAGSYKTWSVKCRVTALYLFP